MHSVFKLRKIKQKALKVVAFGFATVFLCACFAAKIGYDACFRRANAPSDSIFLRYTDIDPLQYPRTLITFQAGDHQLSGFIYGEHNNKGLILISHGLGAGSENYLAETLFFIEQGWRVLVFDNTGSHTSEGASTKGISQSLLDLRAALDFVVSDPTLQKLPLLLYGHSWGGYAVTAILNDTYPITAVVSVAGFSSPRAALYDFAQNRAGIFGVIGFPFFWGYHHILFGADANVSAIDGINSADIPVMIVHGTGDQTLRYSRSGIIAQKTHITNPLVQFVTRDAPQDGHFNLVFSQDALLYFEERQTVWQALQQQYPRGIPADVQAAFYADSDPFRVSALDSELFAAIHQFFENAIELYSPFAD